MTTAEIIQIEAPCSMEAGYTFMANYEDQSFPITVPPGGVVQGQLISIPISTTTSSTTILIGGTTNNDWDVLLRLPTTSTTNNNNNTTHLSSSSNTTTSTTNHEMTPFFVFNSHAVQYDTIGYGYWKDHLFYDWNKYGICHPSIWNAFCCIQLLIGQILVRYQLNLWVENDTTSSDNGNDNNDMNSTVDHDDHYHRTSSSSSCCCCNNRKSWKYNTFVRMFLIVVVFWILYILASPPSLFVWVGDPDSYYHIYRIPIDPTRMDTISYWHRIFYHTLIGSFGFYTWFLLTKVRHYIRRQYHIPSSLVIFPSLFFADYGEDACLSLFCSPCVALQLARQTCDYEIQPAACCSSTGLGQPPILGPWMMMMKKKMNTTNQQEQQQQDKTNNSYSNNFSSNPMKSYNSFNNYNNTNNLERLPASLIV